MSEGSGTTAPLFLEEPDYELIRSRRRSLSLQVYPDGRVVLRVPLRASLKEIGEFYTSHRDWMQKKLARPRPQQQPAWVCRDGATFRFLGQERRLCLEAGKRQLLWSENGLQIGLPAASEAGYQKLLEAWFRQQARDCFSGFIDQHFAYFAARGHARPTLQLKKMRSRWGSLSTRGYINLNIALMQFDPACIEYVVVHELCHLEYMNHGVRFKALMTRLLPDWQVRNRELEQQARQGGLVFAVGGGS